jgi:hypothetical protein
VNELTAPAAPQYDPSEWITPADAVAAVNEVEWSDGNRALIARRAHNGLIRTRCDLVIVYVSGPHGPTPPQRQENIEVPLEVWAAVIRGELDGNWAIGDFQCTFRSLNGRRVDAGTAVKCILSGVKLYRADIEKMLPQRPELPVADDTVPKARGGRPQSEAWRDWIAELALYIHENGAPPGSGNAGADKIINGVEDGLAARGQQGPARSTVQPTVYAVLARIRGAGN